LKTKIGNLKYFFIACPARTYVKNAAYIFVDFRIKTACSSNYGGRLFLPPAKRQVKRQKEKGKISHGGNGC